MSEAHTDCPACPKCSLRCGTTETSTCHMTSVDELRCAACGHYWRANGSDLAQAVRADVAHVEWIAAGRPVRRAG